MKTKVLRLLMSVVSLLIITFFAYNIDEPNNSHAILLPSMTLMPHEDITVERIVHEPEGMRVYRIYDARTQIVCYHSLHGIDCLPYSGYGLGKK
jgi:hypothetical protein